SIVERCHGARHPVYLTANIVMICVFVLKLLFLIVDKKLPFFYFSNHFLRYSQSSIAVLRLCWLLNNHSSFDLIQIVKVKLITNLPANVYRPFFQIKVRKFQTHYFALSQSAEKAEQYFQIPVPF